MGTTKPSELLKLWAQEKLPVEMAMGHALQNLALQQTTIDTLNLTLYRLKSEVDTISIELSQLERNKDSSKKS